MGVRGSYIVSDLHLDGGRDGRRRFARLLRESLEHADQLFILGDLFHYWFGRKHLVLPMYRTELELLRGASRRGLAIEIIPGNRDFLLDRTFSDFTGVKVGGDSVEIPLGDGRAHLSHGDLFATQDVRYLRMRRALRHTMVRFLAHHSPGPVVRWVARRLRGHSERAVKTKTRRELDPDHHAVASLFGHGVETVVCGHFHRGFDETLDLPEGRGRFIVLEPFEERGFVLTHDGRQWGHHFV